MSQNGQTHFKILQYLAICLTILVHYALKRDIQSNQENVYKLRNLLIYLCDAKMDGNTNYIYMARNIHL